MQVLFKAWNHAAANVAATELWAKIDTIRIQPHPSGSLLIFALCKHMFMIEFLISYMEVVYSY